MKTVTLMSLNQKCSLPIYRRFLKRPINWATTKLYISASIILVFMFIGCKEKGAVPAQKPSNAVVIYKSPVPSPAVPLDTNKTEDVPVKIEMETPKRNPFKPALIQKGLPKEQPKTQNSEIYKKIVKPEQPILPKTPLQRYDIMQLKLVAVILGGDDSAAMVESPDGKGYTVRVGDFIGNKGGKVSRILSNKIVIEETYKMESGIVRKRESFITMPASDGDKL